MNQRPPQTEPVIDVNNLPWPAVIYYWNGQEFIIEAFNQKAGETEKVEPKEIIGHPLKKVFPGVEAFGLYQHLIDAINNQKGDHYDAALYQDERIQGWRENYILPLSKQRLLVIYHDATQSVEQQQELMRLGLIVQNSFNEIYIFNRKTCHFRYANAAALENLGYSLEELKEKAPFDIKPEYTQKQFKQLLTPLLKKEKPYIIFETKHCRKDGSTYDVEIRMQLMSLGGEEEVVVIARDISARKQAERKSQLLERAIEQSDELIRITDANGVVTYVNQAFCDHTGYSKEEFIGKKNNLLRSGLHDNAFYQNLWSTLLKGETYKGTFINRKKDGTLYYESETITPIINEHGKTTHFIATGKDITEQRKLEEQLRTLADYDALTQIYNRRKITELLEEELNRFQRNPSQSFGVLMLDIDHFKKINDTYGHDVGDAALKTFSETLKTYLRKSDHFGRLGGEEFLIIAPDTTKEALQALADKLRKTISDTPFPHIQHLTTSIGAAASHEGDTADTLLKRADTALYQAKEAGRNQVKIL
jgi:diguanylate cyclase (GGDEF)-like protein/PAS domain S-box-containing protein